MAKNGKDFPPRLRRNDSVKKNFNHRWTQINTDEEKSERRSGPDFRRSLNDPLYVLLEYHVFYPCPSVSICVHLWLKFFYCMDTAQHLVHRLPLKFVTGLSPFRRRPVI